ncbi:PLDc N-terminal domain-containing protein [Roseivirga sp.]|uniref:PLDc N-terminal domain-containing protein n=1 Tax=Roseivirga sp. TaxID=1964215 RepID=UPI003B8ACE96
MDSLLTDNFSTLYQVLIIAHFILLVYALYVFLKSDENTSKRAFSFLLLLLIPLFGSLIYLRFQRGERRRFSLKKKS